MRALVSFLCEWICCEIEIGISIEFVVRLRLGSQSNWCGVSSLEHCCVINKVLCEVILWKAIGAVESRRRSELHIKIRAWFLLTLLFYISSIFILLIFFIMLNLLISCENWKKSYNLAINSIHPSSWVYLV